MPRFVSSTSHLMGAFALVGLLLAAGCKPAESNADDAGKKADSAKKEAETAPPQRETTAGLWQLQIAMSTAPPTAPLSAMRVLGGYMDISQKDDTFQIEQFTPSRVLGQAKLAEDSTVSAKKLSLVFKTSGGTTFHLKGQFSNNAILGHLQLDGPGQLLVKMVPAEEEEATEDKLGHIMLGKAEHLEKIQEALQADDPLAALRKGKKEWLRDPAYFLAWAGVFGDIDALDLSLQETKQAVADFQAAAKPWGQAVVDRAGIEAAIGLLNSGTEIEYANSLLAKARQTAPQFTKLWQEPIDAALEMAAIATAWNKVQSGKTEEGLGALRDLSAKNPTGEIVTYRLASAERDYGSKKQANHLFAMLAVLPRLRSQLGAISSEEGFVPPSEAAQKLYVARTGSEKGLKDYLLSIYDETITSFLPADEKDRPATESDRVVLLELFTGASCPPCVAADVGTEAIQRSFPDNDVVLLRYHLHIPAPDPLVTEADQARLEYYLSDVRGTPTVFVNGSKAPFPVGGLYGRAKDVYKELAGLLTMLVQEPAGAKLELAATAEGTDLHIKASGTVPDDVAKDAKLRVVIAENDIAFDAPNGILEHSMIVRGMPTGAEGVSGEKGAFSYEETVSLLDLRKKIAEYLKDFEEQHGIELEDSPGSLRHLSVVAFLQNDVTHQVLQAASVPIEQAVELPPVESPDKKKSESEQAETSGTTPDVTPKPAEKKPAEK